jgi:hypothetical protein
MLYYSALEAICTGRYLGSLFGAMLLFTEEAQIYSFLPKYGLNPGQPLGNKVFINPFLLTGFIWDQ